MSNENEITLTCNIFIRTTSSEPGSVPTNLACVTASAMFSIAGAATSTPGSRKCYMLHDKVESTLQIGMIGRIK